jgi:hypothetical protein
MRSFFTAATAFLQTRLPVTNKLLRHLSCIDPKKKVVGSSSEAIVYIGKKFRLNVSDIDKLNIEWALYCLEKVPESISHTGGKHSRVDHYWREILAITTADGVQKYPTLAVVVKTALIIPHSNADVERSLSINNRTVTIDRSNLGEETVIGLRATKDYVKFCDPVEMLPEKILITKDVLLSAKKAHSLYKARLEEDRIKKAEEESKKKEKADAEARNNQDRLLALQRVAQFKDKERQLKETEASVMQKISVVNALLKDGNSKLADSLQKK